jgi:hypothetical protein
LTGERDVPPSSRLNPSRAGFGLDRLTILDVDHRLLRHGGRGLVVAHPVKYRMADLSAWLVRVPVGYRKHDGEHSNTIRSNGRCIARSRRSTDRVTDNVKGCSWPNPVRR